MSKYVILIISYFRAEFLKNILNFIKKLIHYDFSAFEIKYAGGFGGITPEWAGGCLFCKRAEKGGKGWSLPDGGGIIKITVI